MIEGTRTGLHCPKCGKELHTFAVEQDITKAVYHTYCEYGHFWDVIVTEDHLILMRRSKNDFNNGKEWVDTSYEAYIPRNGKKKRKRRARKKRAT